jgi:hypothetical protein
VGDSGIISTQMGTHIKSNMVAVFGTPCVIPLRIVTGTRSLFPYQIQIRDITLKIVHALAAHRLLFL